MLAILPEVWFEHRHTALLVVLAIVCLTIVIKGADWLVEGAAGLAYRLGMPKVVIGATIVSLGTTSPEAAVSVLAAWSDNAGLALGNGVGSVIADTGLIFALGCLITRLPADFFILKRQGVVWISAAVVLAGICYGLYAYHGDALMMDPVTGEAMTNARGQEIPMARVGRGFGLLLVSGLIAYLAMSVRWSRQHTEHAKAASGDNPGEAAGLDPVMAEADQVVEDRPLPMLLLMGLGGLAIVILAGDGLVQSVAVVTQRWGVPEVVVAATLIAFGTSLPELMVGITSIRKGHPELLVGNVIGADILNILFVIGASALAKPLAILEPGTPAPAIFLYLHLPVMLTMMLIMLGGILGSVRSGYFTRRLGVPLLALYISFIVTQFVLTGSASAH